MPRTKKAKPAQTTAQQLSALIKSVRQILRKDKGLNGDADRLPLLTWVMFLKFLDDLETRKAVAEALFKVITEHFAELQSQRLLALSFEMIELHPELNFKQNNVHAFLKNQAG